MFLVELPTGSQRRFGSFDELAGAIRRGELSSRTRIYHRAAAQWLPITVHPEFRRLSAPPPDVPLPPLARTKWTFFAVESAQPPTQDGGSNGESGQPSQAAVTAAKPTPSGWRGKLVRAIGRIRPSHA